MSPGVHGVYPITNIGLHILPSSFKDPRLDSVPGVHGALLQPSPHHDRDGGAGGAERGAGVLAGASNE